MCSKNTVIHCNIIQNLYDFLLPVEHKKKILCKNVLSYNGSQWIQQSIFCVLQKTHTGLEWSVRACVRAYTHTHTNMNIHMGL